MTRWSLLTCRAHVQHEPLALRKRKSEFDAAETRGRAEQIRQEARPAMRARSAPRRSTPARGANRPPPAALRRR